MDRPVIIGIALLLTCTLASCAPVHSPSSGPTSTTTGRAVAGPVCPVERTPPDPACAPRPVAGASFVITGADGREVARTTSDPDGRWTLDLPPGAYTLTPQPVVGLLGTASPMPFTVSASGPTVVADVMYDTGIR